MDEQNQQDSNRSKTKESNITIGDLECILHDLYKPLHPILGYAEILQGASEDPDINEYSAHLFASAKYMKRLIDEIKDSALDSRGMNMPNLEKISLNEIIDDVSFYVKARAGTDALKKDVKLIKSYLPEDKKVYTDKVKILRIMYNLVSNANDFTKSIIEIGFTPGPVGDTKEERFYTGFVRDDGTGISQEVQDKLKQKDYELEKDPNRIYSSGIGLKKSKKLANILGGELNFSSYPNKGTTFYFTFRDMQQEFNKTYKNKQ